MEFHPIANIFPMMGDVELGELADDINRSVIREQVEMGVAVRMAVLDLLSRWRSNQPPHGSV